MANRYSNRSDRERDRDRNRNRGEGFGGSRREQNYNEYDRGQQTGGYNQSFGSSYSPGQSYSSGQRFGGGNWGSRWGRGDFDRSDIGTHFGGGSYQDFGRSGRSGSDRERAWQGRADVGRDFMTNQPIFENYGEIDDRNRQSSFGSRSSGDYGREFRYSEPNRDFSERGGYSGGSYGNYGSRGFDEDRTEFDESIAGRPYYGSGSRGYYREGWRGYGARPGNMGFGDRERPDQWNREAYGSGRRDFFNTDYSSTEYSGYYPRTRDDSWNWDRGERSDYDRTRFGREETFGEKVKNFFGIGPKGYKRSDDRIREDISERLEDHPSVDASGIEVTVNDGIVTLTGTTDDRGSKRLAEDVADRVRGVKDVNNQLRVQYGAGETGRTGTSLGDLSSSSPTTSTTTGTTKKGTERAA
jgi:hypothetical protein